MDNTQAMNTFSFRDPEYRSNPWKVFGDFRNQGPVIRMKVPWIGQGWAATNYEAVTEVLRNDELFLRSTSAGRWNFRWIRWIAPRSLRTLANNLLSQDGQTHRRLRSFVDQAFNRRNIEGMSTRLQALANHQLDWVQTEFQQRGKVDLVEHYARPFPLSAICELLGIPDDHRSDFHRWFRPISNFRGPLDVIRLFAGIRNMHRFLAKQFEQARNQSTPGLISELVADHASSGDAGDRLTDDELMSMVMLLFIAGHETTVHLISNCMLVLEQHPEVLSELKGDWSLCDRFVEEVLRYNSPIQIAKPRFVARDTEFHGQSLRKGELVIPLLASANYDPEKFERPNEFNMHRDPNYHLSFGSGPHTCLGIKLARSETRIALQSLYRRFDRVEAAFDHGQVDWAKRPGMRGLHSFRVRLGNSSK